MAEEQIKKEIGHKNEKVGEVVSTKMAKTIVVEVVRRVPHPVYKRIVTKRKKFYAHDEQESAKPGDVVRIIECRHEHHVGDPARTAGDLAIREHPGPRHHLGDDLGGGQVPGQAGLARSRRTGRPCRSPPATIRTS